MPLHIDAHLVHDQGEPYFDPGRYKRLVGKLNYLTVTPPDNAFTVSIVNQFLNSLCQYLWDVVVQILKYIKKAFGKHLIYEDKGNT